MWISEVSVECHFLLPLCFIDNRLFSSKYGTKSASRATRKKCATRRTRGMVLSPVSLGGSTYFLWKKCVVFQQPKNNFHLSCQFFENRRSMCMLLFLPYDRSDRTFYSQTKVNSKTSKVIASRCYTWSLGIKKSYNTFPNISLIL